MKYKIVPMDLRMKLLKSGMYHEIEISEVLKFLFLKLKKLKVNLPVYLVLNNIQNFCSNNNILAKIRTVTHI